MKKLITLLLLFAITLFYSIPTQAYTLDGNDIPLVQTKNLFDKSVNTFEQGGIDGSGNNVSFIDRARNIGFIPINSSTQYIASVSSPFQSRAVYYYTSSFTFISLLVIDGATFTTPSNASYIRFALRSISPIDAVITTANLTTINNTFQLERGSTATSYAPYGFLTLNYIFLDGNIILNTQFLNTSNWTTLNSTNSVLNNELINTGNGSSTAPLTFATINGPTTSIASNVIVYGRATLKVDNANSTSISVGSGNSQYIASQTTPLANQPYNLSFRGSSTVATTAFIVIHSYSSTALANGAKIFIKNPLLIDLNSLGISNLRLSEMDYYYNLWQQNNAYIEGYNDGYDDGFDDGFDDGYDEGFDDGVASDTSYAVGYALGLSEGEDMETGSSLLILIVALIGFVMMIFGFTTKRGIFNLLSVGAFVVLGTLLVQFVGFVIIAIGLVLINIYYAFFGDL
jgi:hypothetical protein